MGKYQIESLTQISNLPSNGFKSFSHISNFEFPFFFKFQIFQRHILTEIANLSQK